MGRTDRVLGGGRDWSAAWAGGSARLAGRESDKDELEVVDIQASQKHPIVSQVVQLSVTSSRKPDKDLDELAEVLKRTEMFRLPVSPLPGQLLSLINLCSACVAAAILPVPCMPKSFAASFREGGVFCRVHF